VSKPVKTAKFVRRCLKTYGFQKVREGIIKWRDDNFANLDHNEKLDWFDGMMLNGQVAMSRASTQQLIEEIGDWDRDDDEYETIEDHIRPPLEGEARPMKEESK
jgi:hypothetical protein